MQKANKIFMAIPTEFRIEFMIKTLGNEPHKKAIHIIVNLRRFWSPSAVSCCRLSLEGNEQLNITDFPVGLVSRIRISGWASSMGRSSFLFDGTSSVSSTSGFTLPARFISISTSLRAYEQIENLHSIRILPLQNYFGSFHFGNSESFWRTALVHVFFFLFNFIWQNFGELAINCKMRDENWPNYFARMVCADRRTGFGKKERVQKEAHGKGVYFEAPTVRLHVNLPQASVPSATCLTTTRILCGADTTDPALMHSNKRQYQQVTCKFAFTFLLYCTFSMENRILVRLIIFTLADLHCEWTILSLAKIYSPLTRWLPPSTVA